MNRAIFLAAALASAGATANATPITFLPEDLDTIPSATVGGVTVTGSTSDGSIGTIEDGSFEGLHIGQSALAGNFQLAFSRAVTSIEVFFQGLSRVNGGESEALTGFATEDGAISVSFLNTDTLWGGDIGDASFDGTTITPDAPPPESFTDADFKIAYSGAAFSSLFFQHTQDDGSLGGVVIKRIDIVLAPIPLPAAGVLLIGAVGGLGLLRRRRPV